MSSIAQTSIEAYVGAQVAVIDGLGGQVIENAPDAVHASRVACRRLRCTLSTFRPLWRSSHRGLRGDLRRYGALLGGARDTEVLKQGLLALVDEVGGNELARSRIEARLDDDHERALEQLRAGMSEGLFEELRIRLTRLVVRDRWEDLALAPASPLLPALAFSASQTAKRLLLQLPAEGPDREHRRHELRKRTKSVRYAYEALAAGDPEEELTRTAKAEADRWKLVTESLGDVQDTVVGREFLTLQAAGAAAQGESTEVFQAMIARLARSGEVAEVRAFAVLRDALDNRP